MVAIKSKRMSVERSQRPKRHFLHLLSLGTFYLRALYCIFPVELLEALFQKTKPNSKYLLIECH